MTEPRLMYRRPLLCVAHEIAPGDDQHAVAHAEIIVDGFSLCYPCGQLWMTAITEGKVGEFYVPDMVKLLKLIRAGQIEVAR